MTLTEAEKIVLVTGLGIGAEHYANKAAVRYTGYGYRRLFGTTVAITLPFYLGGMAASYHIGGSSGLTQYRQVVSDILTQDNVEARKVAFVHNVQEGILKPLYHHVRSSGDNPRDWSSAPGMYPSEFGF